MGGDITVGNKIKELNKYSNVLFCLDVTRRTFIIFETINRIAANNTIEEIQIKLSEIGIIYLFPRRINPISNEKINPILIGL